MKKIVLIACICVMAVWAFAQDIQLSAGVSLDYGMIFDSAGQDEDNKMDTTLYMISVGAYFDATFVSLAVSYTTNIAKPDSTLTMGGSSSDYPQDDDFSISALNIALIGRYPIDMGGFYLYPALGIQYMIVFNLDPDGNGNIIGDPGSDDLNDIVILCGVGAAFMMDSFVISPRVFITYNLMPCPDSDGVSSGDFATQWGFTAGVSVGYLF
jgi:hypothetical protein